MRGRLINSGKPAELSGNTPAYAGKTESHDRIPSPDKKHPRVCGEDKYKLNKKLEKTETPPRMRGRLQVTKFARDKIRNTPAYAGKTIKCPFLEL